jgi:hypothetical protein
MAGWTSLELGHFVTHNPISLTSGLCILIVQLQVYNSEPSVPKT